MTASRWLKKLTADGVLEEVTKGCQATGNASEYRYGPSPVVRRRAIQQDSPRKA